MKIRQGFISNSSSSSFIIFGIKLNEKELENLSSNKLILDEMEELDDYDTSEAINSYCDKNNLSFYQCENEVDSIIGVNVISTYNDQIVEISQLSISDQQRCRKELSKLDLIKDKEPAYYLVGIR